MAEAAVDANAAQRRYWNTVAGPRWVASPGFRERRNQESLSLLLARLGLTWAYGADVATFAASIAASILLRPLPPVRT